MAARHPKAGVLVKGMAGAGGLKKQEQEWRLFRTRMRFLVFSARKSVSRYYGSVLPEPLRWWFLRAAHVAG